MRSFLILLVFMMATSLPAVCQEETFEEIFAKVKQAWSEVNNYECMMRSSNRLGNQNESKKLRFCFKRPHQVRVEVEEGENEGSVLMRDAAGVIRGHKGGLLSIAKIKLDETDARIVNLRNRKFYLADWGSVINELQHGLDSGWPVKYAGQEEFNQFPCHKIGMKWQDPNSPLTSEFIWVETETNTILQREQYEDGRPVNQVQWWDIKKNIGLSDDLFQ